MPFGFSPELAFSFVGIPMLQAILNSSERYLEPLSEESRGPRHGNYFEQASTDDDVLRERAWTLMNRFIGYLKRDKTKLPDSEFPRL
jgi:hypothetical protein